MLFQRLSTVFDAGPRLKQHWVNASCLLGSHGCRILKMVLHCVLIPLLNIQIKQNIFRNKWY